MEGRGYWGGGGGGAEGGSAYEKEKKSANNGMPGIVKKRADDKWVPV